MRNVESRVKRLERRREAEHPTICAECGGRGKPRWAIVGGIRGSTVQRFGGCWTCRLVSILHRLDWRLPEERAAEPEVRW